MIGTGAVYALAGLLFGAIAVINAIDCGDPRRWRKAAFWGLFCLSFLFGDVLGDLGNGVLVLAMVVIAATGAFGGPLSTESPKLENATPNLGDRLFLPVLIVPITTLVGTLVFPHLRLAGVSLVETRQVTVISMALGVVLALGAAMAMLRAPPSAPAREARRLLDQVGWAAILPQLLAALGAVFALAGVGHSVGDLISLWLPGDSRFAIVATYCLGMAAFTMIMGNAFAAFPVLTAGLGAPLIVGKFGGDPAIMGALGMLSGYCGTLMTPMASHNIIPTALLGLPQGAVIRAQAPTAIIVLLGNIVLMYSLVFHR